MTVEMMKLVTGAVGRPSTVELNTSMVWRLSSVCTVLGMTIQQNEWWWGRITRRYLSSPFGAICLREEMVVGKGLLGAKAPRRAVACGNVLSLRWR